MSKTVANELSIRSLEPSSHRPVGDQPPTDRITEVMKAVLLAKEENFAEADASFWRKKNPVMIGGDVFGFTYILFEGIKELSSKLAATPAMHSLSMGFGTTGGVINIGVGLYTLFEGVKALQDGKTEQGARLVFLGLVVFIIGLVMIATSLGSKVGLGGISTFLTGNPFILPLLFSLPSMILMKEVLPKILKQYRGEDDLSKLLSTDDVNEQMKKIGLDSFENTDEETVLRRIIEKMEELQEIAGARAAIATFKHLIAKRENEVDESFDVQAKTSKRVLKARFTQQCLNITSLVMGVIATALGARSTLGHRLTLATDGIMAGTRVIPLTLDTFYPYERNVPVVVAAVKAEKIAQNKFAV